MTIPRVKPAGWGFGEQLSSAQCTELDEHITRAVDGQDGGAFTPTAPITIGGSGVTLTSTDNILSGTLTVDGDIQLDAVLEVGDGLGSVTFEGTTGRPLLGSRQLVRVQSTLPSYNPSEWATNGGVSCIASVTTVATMTHLLDLPHGSQLNEVNITVQGVMSGATMPTSMPTLKIWKRPYNNPAATSQIGVTVTDTSPDRTAFEAVHALDLDGLTETIDRTLNMYYVQVTSPNGGNTAAGFTVQMPCATFTVTQMDDGAS